MQCSNFTKGVIFTTLGGVGWGISGVCGQYVFHEYHIDSSWLTATRMILSGVLLLLAIVPKEKKKIFCIFKEKENIPWLLSFALIGLLLCQYSFLETINLSNSATATVLQSLNVIMMALIVSASTGKRITLLQSLSIFFAILGTYLIATKGSFSQIMISTSTLIWGILSAVGVVTYTLLSRNLIKKFGNMITSGWGMLIGGIIFGVIIKIWHMPYNPDFKFISLILIIIVIGTAVSFPLFLQGAKLIGPVKATLLACIEPVTATILSAIILKTSFCISELLGFTAIIATVILSTLEKRN